MNHMKELEKRNKRNTAVLLTMLAAVIVIGIGCLFVGSSNMSFADALDALLGGGSGAQSRIIWKIRVPRVLAAIIAGAGLAVSGLVMQTTLNNSMASPSTLGVSNAAVFGANLSIIAFAGGFLSTGNNIQSFDVGANPYATSLLAFVFSTVSILLILGLCTDHDPGSDRTPQGDHHHFAVLCHGCGPVRRGDLELWRSGPGHLPHRCHYGSGGIGRFGIFHAHGMAV